MKNVSLRGGKIAAALFLLVGIMAVGNSFTALAYNNPDYVCTEQSVAEKEDYYRFARAQIANEIRYSQVLQVYRTNISVYENQLAQLNNQYKANNNRINNLSNFISNNCSASSLNALRNPKNNSRFLERQRTCDAKKDDRKDANRLDNQLVNQIVDVRNKLNDEQVTLVIWERHLISQSAVQYYKSFVQDYEACKADLSTPIG